jgi:hypothetical protein
MTATVHFYCSLGVRLSVTVIREPSCRDRVNRITLVVGRASGPPQSTDILRVHRHVCKCEGLRMPAPWWWRGAHRGPTYANLRGRKPRDVEQCGASGAMAISSRAVSPRCVDRLFGKQLMGWRVWSADCDGQNRRRAGEIDRRGGCPGRRDGERGHGRSRVGEAEVQNWNVAANLI